MNNLIPTQVAGIIYALAIATYGVRNMIKANSLDTIVPDYIPGGVTWVYITGICMVLAAIAILLNNKFTRIACYLLALMLIIFVFILQIQPAMQGNPGNMLRDIGIGM